MYDENKCQLYLFIIYEHQPRLFFGLNMLNPQYNRYNQYKCYNDQQDEQDQQDTENLQIADRDMLLIDDCIHFIGTDLINDANDSDYSDDSDYTNFKVLHVCWDFNKNNLKIVHQFNDYNNLYGFSFIRLKKRNKLMLIGGYDTDYTTGLDDINIFDLNTNWCSN